MEPTPDMKTLLLAVEKFLDEKIRPTITDPALAFRVRIATHLLQTVQRELVLGPTASAEAAARLRELVGDVAEPGAALLAKITSGSDDDRVRRHLLQDLAADLAINQPRFDLSRDPEAS